MITISVKAFLGICAGIVTISAAIGAIVRGINFVREPVMKQTESINKLSQKTEAIEQRLDSDKQRLDDLETGLKYTLESLLALLSHAIDGNEVDGLKKAKQHLNDYLIQKVEK